MNFIAAIAICLSSTPVPECQQKTAVHWFTVSEVSSGLSGCMREGMVAAVRSRLLRGEDYPKVFCRPVTASTDNISRHASN
jgi:hypothetical protein